MAWNHGVGVLYDKSEGLLIQSNTFKVPKRELRWTSATNWPIVPAPDDECGAFSGMRTGRRNRSTRRKPAPMPLCPPQIPHDLVWDRTRAAAVGSRRLTA
jgi:hypothetical protein